MTVVKIKKQKAQKSLLQKKIKFKNYQNYLEATQLKNKVNHLEKNEIDVGCPEKDHKEFIKNNKLIPKTQQRFRNERHNVFPEEISKIAIRSNNDKRMQSIGSTETYAYGTKKDLACKKAKIKCNNIIKQYKND